MRRHWSSRSTRWRFAVGCAVVVALAATATAAFALIRSENDAAATICTLMDPVEGVFVVLPFSRERRQVERLETPLRARALARVRANPRLLERERRRVQRMVERHIAGAMGVRRVTVCVDGRCDDVPPRDAFVLPSAIAPLPQPHPDAVDVSVVIDRRGRPLEVATGRLQVEESEPNGRGCGTAYSTAGRVVGHTIVES
jgi:hypothetical protein